MKTTRRTFVKLAAGAPAGSEALPGLAQPSFAFPDDSPDLDFRSRFFRVRLDRARRGFTAFDVESLGNNRVDNNVMLPMAPGAAHYRSARRGDTVDYRTGTEEQPAWAVELSESAMVLRSVTAQNRRGEPVILDFDPASTHSTLLGMVTDEGNILLPAILHFPAHGTVRITSPIKDAVVGYDASRNHGDNFVRVTLPPSTWTWHREIE